ncbi:hypothetical protein BH20CHL1_BH20CHL1_06980 [soil metagenome]
MRRYTIFLNPDPAQGVYTVTVPSLPGVVAQGRNIDESLERAREAIELHLRGLVADGEEIPEESVSPQLATVYVSEVVATV